MLSHLLLALATLLPPGAADPSSNAGPSFIVPPSRKALVIGTNANDRQGRLRYAQGDAVAFAGTLTDSFRFAPGDLRLLVDDAEDPEDRPTAGNMFRHLREMLASEAAAQQAGQSNGPSDLFVFYFAGHGVGLESGDYLLPMDGVAATAEDVGLPVRDVVQEFVAAGVKNVLFVVDGCRTGAENPFGEELWQLAEQADLSLVLACEPGEISNEDARLGGGVFTRKLIEVLEDEDTLDEVTGTLWASRVAERTAEAVTAYTRRGFGGAQHPRIWTDPTRDVLLGAALPQRTSAAADTELGDDPSFEQFLEQVGLLDTQGYLDALGYYANALYQAERHAECAALLAAAAELGTFDPYSLYVHADCLQVLGRQAEKSRVQAELLARFPDSYEALVVLAHDLSGETPASVRYEASWRMWTEWPVYNVDEAILIVFNLHNGGPPERARQVLDEVLPLVDPITRGGAYLGYIDLLLRGELDEAIALLERAEGYPGAYPDVDRLRQEQFGLYESLQWGDRLDSLLDSCLEERPDDPLWLVRRAVVRHERGDWDGALSDARATLASGLADPTEFYPWMLLDAVRAAGIRADEVRDLVEPLADGMPLSWKAGMARTFAMAMDTDELEAMTDPEAQAALAARLEAEVQDATDAAKRLAPGLGVWTAEIARIKHEHLQEALVRGELPQDDYQGYLFDIFQTLAERAGEFLDEEAGWEVMIVIGQELDRHHQLAELVRLHLGERIAAAQLPPDLIDVIAVALLGDGDLDAFRAALRSIQADTALGRSFRWYELVYLICSGREAEAVERLADAPEPTDGMQGVATWVRLHLATRGLLEGAPAPTEAELEAEDPVLARGEAAAPLEAALIVLTWEHLGLWGRAEAHLGSLLEGPAGSRAVFARIAGWKALQRHAQDDPAAMVGIPWVAGRAALGVPEASAISYRPGATVDDYRGSYELFIGGGGGELVLPLADVFLSVRKGGKVSGVVEGREDEAGMAEVWSLSGTIDAGGVVEAELKGAPRKARVLLKLPPPDLLTEVEPIVAYGIMVMVLDDEARASTWGLFPSE